MRFANTIVALAGLAAAPFAAAQSATPEALRDAVKAAFEARSVAAWKANVACETLGANDLLVLDKTLASLFAANPATESLELGPLPDGFDPVLVGGGRKYVMTVEPVGVITLRFRIGKRSNEIALPYGKVGSGYKLGTLRGEKLSWKGPEDRTFTVVVAHAGDPADIAVRVKFNASGVDLEKRFTRIEKPLSLPAQYIDSVEVVRTGAAKGETSLEIYCQGAGDANDRKVVHKSDVLRRAGLITFRRDAAAK